MYKSILFLFFIASTSFYALAQKTRIVVQDVSTQEALAQVEIYTDQQHTQLLGKTNALGVLDLAVNQLVNGNIWLKHPDYFELQKQVTAGNTYYIPLFPKTIEKEAVSIKAIRANDQTPTTYTNLSKKDIDAKNFGQDFPYLLQATPAAVVFSDAGAGVGYTGIRIRGVDQTRINVTLNGVPINDGESQGVFWVDLPDISSSTGSVQIQRGVGTSTNGAAAFGASINVLTDNLPKKAFAQYQTGIGSFNTSRNTLQFGTGLLPNNWNLSGRLSFIKSDGFIDRASSDLNSWYLSSSKTMKKGVFKTTIFAGHERTYQAWYGVPQPKFKNDSVQTERFMENLYMSETEAQHVRNSKPQTYNPYTYKNQVDDYKQTYYQFFYNHFFNKNLALNTAAFYTKGGGFYEEFKQAQALTDYGLNNLTIDSTTITHTDLVRRRWLDNHLVGANYALTYQQSSFSVFAGGGLSSYWGQHFGEVIWAKFASNANTEHEYYRNKAEKTEFNQYIKANYNLKKWSLFADLQLRGLEYEFVGPDRNNNPTDREVNYLFFNPKAGITYWLNPTASLYTSIAIANREPVRDDFVNSSAASAPKAEKLTNLEAGYRLKKDRIILQLNGYLMQYKDQLVLTGKINDVGAYTRTNINNSYRLGLETEASINLTKTLQWTGNVALSENKIAQFTEYVDDWDGGNQVVNTYKQTTLAFSPSLVAASQFRLLPLQQTHFFIDIINKYVSKQYLDNTASDLRALDAFWLQDISFSYALLPNQLNQHIKGLKFSALINNLFNVAYAPNGYTFSGITGGVRNDFNYVYPQAGTNFMIRLTADF